MYIIISYKLRSTTPLPLPPVPFNCKAKGVWILTSAVWISALMPVKQSGRRRFHNIRKFESGLTVCHWKWTAKRSRVYESTFCTYLWVSVFMCASSESVLHSICHRLYVCIYTHFYLLCLYISSWLFRVRKMWRKRAGWRSVTLLKTEEKVSKMLSGLFIDIL